MQKGLISERMILPIKGNRVGPSLLPLKNVKTLPSKWEDAERWIFSPAYGDISHKPQVQQCRHHRKPKAKSGPLAPPGSAYYSMYTPVISGRRSISDQMGISPLSTGLEGTKRLSTLYDELGKGSSARLDPWMSRSVSLRGCSVEHPGKSSLLSSQVSADDKEDKMNDKATNLSCPVSRQDIATHISPSDSTNSSFKRISSHNNEQAQSSCTEIKDVEMDEKKITIGSLKTIHRGKSLHFCSSSNGDEARIIAWETLQKAKADAAIKKLEIKLETKKATSMDKIMKKLKSDQKKAQKMRIYVVSNQPDQRTKASSTRRRSYTSKVWHKSLLSSCFTCHAFVLP